MEQCPFVRDGRRCIRWIGHDGDHRLPPPRTDAPSVIVDLTPPWRKALRRWWRQFVRLVR